MFSDYFPSSSVDAMSPTSGTSWCYSWASFKGFTSVKECAMLLTSSLPNDLVTGSAGSIPLFFILALTSCYSKLVVYSDGTPGYASPGIPHVFALLDAFFGPPASYTESFVSPGPFYAFSDYSHAVSGSYPVHSFDIFYGFSSAVDHVSSEHFSMSFDGVSY